MASASYCCMSDCNQATRSLPMQGLGVKENEVEVEVIVKDYTASLEKSLGHNGIYGRGNMEEWERTIEGLVAEEIMYEGLVCFTV